MSRASQPTDRPTNLGRAVRLLGSIEIIVAVAAFTSGVSISAWQILLRSTTGASVWWGQEVSLLLMMVAYFVGASVVFRQRGYVVIDFFVERLPRSLQLAAYVFAQVAILSFWGIVIWELAWMSSDALRTYTPIIRLPKLYFQMPLMYAASSIALTTICVLASLRRTRAWGAGSVIDLEREVAVSLNRGLAP